MNNLTQQATIEGLEQTCDALTEHMFVFKDLYLAWDASQIDDEGFIARLASHAEGLPGASLVKRDALKQAQALEGALAAIDRDPVGAREEIEAELARLRQFGP
jgi:hypothetical protein